LDSLQQKKGILKPASILARPQGTRVTLVQLAIDHLEPYLEMLAVPESRALTATTKQFSREQIVKWLSTRAQTANRRDWAIVDERGEFCGEVVLNEFDDDKNQMNLRICLRGPEYFSRGIGRQAIALALVTAFDTLSLDKVTLEVLVNNPRAIASYSAVGFDLGRQFNDKTLRYQRMSINKWQFVRALCEAGIAQHLDTNVWSFEFDNGKRRAGLCNYSEHRITISKHLVGIHTVDESLQVLAHEIAHALSGKGEGHGKKWLATAKSLGYRAEKFSGNEIARETAPWIGVCPNGHEHYRYRKPARALSCGLCSRKFSNANLIAWRKAD
jgi:RimJ/RimL family protein N-acetyltransferase